MKQMTRVAALATTAALTLAATATAASAADLYMAADGTDAGACSSSAAPCQTWDYTQAQASGGDTIHFAAGTYVGAIAVDKALTLEGAQAGVPAPGRSASESIINGPGGGFAALTINAANVTVDGFWFANRVQATAIRTNASNTTIANTRAGDPNFYDSGIQSFGGDGAVVRDSIAQGYSAGIQASGSITVTGSQIASQNSGISASAALTATSNTFGGAGARGVTVQAGTATLHGNRFAPGLQAAINAMAGSTVNAENNWFGCNAGAGASGCLSVTGAGQSTVEPHLVLAASVNPAKVAPNGAATVGATLRSSDGSANPYALPPVSAVSLSATAGSLDATSLQLGQTTTLTAPGTTGDGALTATLDNETVTAPYKIRVPGLTVDPASHGFGTVAPQTGASTQSFTVTNGSGDPIRVRSITLQGPNAGEFALYANACRTTLPDSGTCAMSAVFRPTFPGARSASIVIAADGLDPISIPLSGTGGFSFPLQVTPGSLDLGLASVGGSSPRQSMTVTNTASTPTRIVDVTVSGSGVAASVDACRTTLAPGATCTVSAVLKPQTTGPQSGSITFRIQAGTTWTSLVDGTGVAPALTVSPDDGRYGTVAVGKSSSKRTFTVTNNGATNAPVDVQGISLSGANAGEFTLYAGSCAKKTLAVGASCEVSALLRPTSAGAKAAQITVNASAQPASTITLTGNAS